MRDYIAQGQIEKRIEELAKEIQLDLGQEFMVLGLLNGCFMFLSDLVRKFEGEIEIEFLKVSSYEDTLSTGELHFQSDIPNVKDKVVLLVDDIVDTGHTLYKIQPILQMRGAKEVYTCALLSKKARRIQDVVVEYVGFDIEDEFVIGYGMDYNGKYRNLKQIFIWE